MTMLTLWLITIVVSFNPLVPEKNGFCITLCAICKNRILSSYKCIYPGTWPRIDAYEQFLYEGNKDF